jgi:hypothetical protein
MKKILIIAIVMLLLQGIASAQRSLSERIHRNRTAITRADRLELSRDVFRYETLDRRVRRDGAVTPLERRKLRRAKHGSRTDRFRSRHNSGRRMI